MADGLSIDWFGRVWLNFPYDDPEAGCARWREHNNGTVLMFGRTETDALHEHMSRPPQASCSFAAVSTSTIPTAGGRSTTVVPPRSYVPTGPRSWTGWPRSPAGALSAAALRPLRPRRRARPVVVRADARLDRQAARSGQRRRRVPAFARHPKAQQNQHWRAKVRQKLAKVGRRVERNQYVRAA
jgi:hypothetical protein